MVVIKSVNKNLAFSKNLDLNRLRTLPPARTLISFKIMLLVLGLGNPGKKYEKTRHNIGRAALGTWQKKAGFPDFKFQKKIKALISKGTFNKNEVILALPETFMNLSGMAVKLLFTHYRLPITNLVVIHDDLDLPLGKIKIVKNRGAAGHKGVESIIKELKTKDFARFRVGIQPKSGKPKNVEKFVLQKFNKEEEEIVKEVIKKTAEAIEMNLKIFALQSTCER